MSIDALRRVVDDVRPVLGEGSQRPFVYFALGQQWRPTAASVLVRGSGDSRMLIPVTKDIITRADAFADVYRVQTMTQMVGEILYPRRIAAAVLAVPAVGAPPTVERIEVVDDGVGMTRDVRQAFLGDAVDPLEAALLHPARRHRDAAGVEVEGGADRADHRHVELLAHPRHPLLLARDADADPDDVGAAALDVGDYDPAAGEVAG